MQKYRTMVCIDFDNLSHEQIKGIADFGEDVKVCIYANDENKLTSRNMKRSLSNIVCAVEKIHVEPTSNSADFRIVNDISREIASNAFLKHVYIVSNDSDFNTMIQYWHDTYDSRLRAIEKVSCVKDSIVDYKLLTMKTESQLKEALAMKFGEKRRDLFYDQIIQVIAYGMGA